MIYEGAANLLDWHDGDSCMVIVSTLVAITQSTTVVKKMLRLRGVNCPEINSPDPGTLAAAQKARDFSNGICPPGPVQVTIHGFDKYGRFLGDVSINGQDVGKALLASGNAKVMHAMLEVEP